MTADAAARLRGLPSVDQVLRSPATVTALAAFGHAQTAAAVRGALAVAREAVRAGAPAPDAARSEVGSTVAGPSACQPWLVPSSKS